MRTRLLLLMILFSACATTNQPSSNAQTVRSVYEAFGRGDIPTVLATFDPEMVFDVAESMPYFDRSPYRGPKAVAEGLFFRLGTEWIGFRATPEEIIDGGDTIVALGRYQATNKATGNPLNAQFAHVWTFRNGKVVRVRQFGDTAQFGRATGAIR
jgi:ketosteroid isomerase-like protein